MLQEAGRQPVAAPAGAQTRDSALDRDGRPVVLLRSPGGPSEGARELLEAAGCKVRLGNPDWLESLPGHQAEMLAMAQGCDAIIGMSRPRTPVTRSVMEASPGLRIVAKYGIGVDDVDVASASDLGIFVTHGPAEANWGGVAESAMTMMLAVLKRVRQRDAFVRQGGWHNDDLQGIYVGARDDGYAGLTIGIVGLGRVGGRFARLLAPWRARIVACDPYIEPQRFVEHGVEAVDLPTLLRESDVVSLHVPLNSETRHLVNRAALSLMKPSAIIINTARGSVIDEAAIAAALGDGTIAAAALDVFEREPLPDDSPLRLLGEKVLVSPHIGASNVGAGWEVPGVQWAAEAVIAALRGEVPRHVFNRSVIEAWTARFAGQDLLAAPRR